MDNCNPTPEDLRADFRRRFPDGFKDPRPILQFPKKESQGMIKAELKWILQKNGIEASSLDETVHAAASVLATNANNGGIEEQINFLYDTCGWTPQDIINALEIRA